MPKLRTLIASPYAPRATPAAGLHDPDLIQTHRFHDFVTREAKPRRTLTIGRDKGCDIWIRDPYASRTHLKLERRSDGAMLVSDAQSTNGISIDGEPVFEPVVLMVGMRLRIGEAYLYAVDRRSRYPLVAAMVDELMRQARIVYGSYALAGERIGVSRETVRRRAAIAPFGASV